MPPLKNPRHEKFTKQYAKTLNQTKAYAETYPDSSYLASQSSSSDLLSNPIIQRRFVELCADVGLTKKRAAEILKGCIDTGDNDQKIKGLNLFLKTCDEVNDGTNINLSQFVNVDSDIMNKLANEKHRTNESSKHRTNVPLTSKSLEQ